MKDQLITEWAELRPRMVELEAADAQRERTEAELRSILSVPMRLKENVIGVLQAVDKTPAHLRH